MRHAPFRGMDVLRGCHVIRERLRDESRDETVGVGTKICV